MPWRRVNSHNFDHKILVDKNGRVYDATSCREIKQRVKNGYKAVVLLVDGKYKMFGVHQLVCYAFHGAPPSPEFQPDHINGDKFDNRSRNLEWVTPKTNIRRAKSKKVRGTAADGSYVVFSHLAMAADFGFNVNAISKVLNKRQDGTSQGFHWEYIAD